MVTKAPYLGCRRVAVMGEPIATVSRTAKGNAGPLPLEFGLDDTAATGNVIEALAALLIELVEAESEPSNEFHNHSSIKGLKT